MDLYPFKQNDCMEIDFGCEPFAVYGHGLPVDNLLIIFEGNV